MSSTPRRAALADADALSALAGELFPDACPSFLPRSAIDAFIAENLSIEAFREHLAHPSWRAWVTERSDQTAPSGAPGQRAVAPVGSNLLAYTLVGLSPTTDETVLAATDGRGAAYLSKMYARPEVRGTGVAETLCRETMQALAVEGQAFVWLGTHVDNARANAFYERLGFTIIGERIFDVGGVQARDWVRLARL